MLKKLVSISLIGAILLTLVRFTLPYLWYYSNQSYIATELCIHQHRLDHHCDGTCQLKKMLQKTHDHGGQQPAQHVDTEQRINLFVSDGLSVPLKPTLSSFQIALLIDQTESIWIGEPVSPPPRMG